jgi:hypothetical protein
MSTVVEIVKPSPLAELAEQINAEHSACEAAIRDSLAHAKTCGELLIQAKQLVAFGDWNNWLMENFAGSCRTAQAYMRIAKHWPKIEAKAQRVAELSFRQALRLAGDETAGLQTLDEVRQYLDELETLPANWWRIEWILYPLRDALPMLGGMAKAATTVKQCRDLAGIALRIQNRFAMQRLLSCREVGRLLIDLEGDGE